MDEFVNPFPKVSGFLVLEIEQEVVADTIERMLHKEI